ncbi:unnamed protein product [Lactuca saligna]|uniref:Phosphofructokinase domain-containing protein n=1 Tax=Lactuca saligna TaxID=75948 RepID=A0AA35ZWE8_LACSI|nr:unnamed protein product [Lactuca saligna]
MWHIHEYEVKSDVLFLPGVIGPVERQDREKAPKTNGKTIHFFGSRLQNPFVGAAFQSSLKPRNVNCLGYLGNKFPRKPRYDIIPRAKKNDWISHGIRFSQSFGENVEILRKNMELRSGFVVKSMKEPFTRLGGRFASIPVFCFLCCDIWGLEEFRKKKAAAKKAASSNSVNGDLHDVKTSVADAINTFNKPSTNNNPGEDNNHSNLNHYSNIGALLGTYEDNIFKSESKKPYLKSIGSLNLGGAPELEKKLKYTEHVCSGDCCLIPESPFYLKGQGGLFEFIQHRLKENGHVVIVLAEGVDQEYVSESVNAVEEREMHLEINCLLILVNDPTYIIRAIPSNAYDNIYCTLLAQSAIHGAMAGFSGFTVGRVNNRHAYIPIQPCSSYLTGSGTFKKDLCRHESWVSRKSRSIGFKDKAKHMGLVEFLERDFDTKIKAPKSTSASLNEKGNHTQLIRSLVGDDDPIPDVRKPAKRQSGKGEEKSSTEKELLEFGRQNSIEGGNILVEDIVKLGSRAEDAD